MWLSRACEHKVTENFPPHPPPPAKDLVPVPSGSGEDAFIVFVACAAGMSDPAEAGD